MAMVMRLRTGASIATERLTRIVEGRGPRVIVGRVRPATALVSQHVETPRNRMLLLTLLGGVGLLLTLVGIASVTGYAVTRRTREIGVRAAFGARPVHFIGMVMRDAAWPVALGLVAGLVGTYYATSLVAGFLFETTPHDPVTVIAASGLLAGAAAAAAWLPAARAASIDPLSALRAE